MTVKMFENKSGVFAFLTARCEWACAHLSSPIMSPVAPPFQTHSNGHFYSSAIRTGLDVPFNRGDVPQKIVRQALPWTWAPSPAGACLGLGGPL